MEDELAKQTVAENNEEMEKVYETKEKQEQVDKQSEDSMFNARLLNALGKIFKEE